MYIVLEIFYSRRLVFSEEKNLDEIFFEVYIFGAPLCGRVENGGFFPRVLTDKILFNFPNDS